MNIEQMAREACGGDSPIDDDGGAYFQPGELARFAALVRDQALDEATSDSLPMPVINVYPAYETSLTAAYYAGIKHHRQAILALKERTQP